MFKSEVSAYNVKKCLIMAQESRLTWSTNSYSIHSNSAPYAMCLLRKDEHPLVRSLKSHLRDADGLILPRLSKMHLASCSSSKNPWHLLNSVLDSGQHSLNHKTPGVAQNSISTMHTIMGVLVLPNGPRSDAEDSGIPLGLTTSLASILCLSTPS